MKKKRSTDAHKQTNKLEVTVQPTLSGVLSPSHLLEGKAVVPVQQITCVTPCNIDLIAFIYGVQSFVANIFPFHNVRKDHRVFLSKTIIQQLKWTKIIIPQILKDPNPLGSACHLVQPSKFRRYFKNVQPGIEKKKKT